MGKSKIDNKTNYTRELDSIIQGMEDSIFSLSEEEINVELKEMGENPDKIAHLNFLI